MQDVNQGYRGGYAQDTSAQGYGGSQGEIKLTFKIFSTQFC